MTENRFGMLFVASDIGPNCSDNTRPELESESAFQA